MLDGSLRETKLPVCVSQPRGQADACMSVFLGLVGAFKSIDQNRGEQRDECGRATKWSPPVEDVRCPNIASTAEFSLEYKEFGVWNPICSHELILFYFIFFGRKGRKAEVGLGSTQHLTRHLPFNLGLPLSLVAPER